MILLLGACAALGQDGLVANSPAEPEAARAERTLLFVGDVMLSRGVGAKMKSEDDWSYPFRKIAERLRAADLAIANLECPISDAGRNRYHLYSFRADPRALEGLTHAGFDVVSVANNHMYDWGPEALLDTLRRLREAGILPVGAGANDLEAHYPLIVDLGGVRLGFLAYVNVEPRAAIAGPEKPGVAWLDPERVLADIRFARPLADVLIVSLHWGVEYAARPQRSQVKLARRMIDVGAHLIVGHHAHVVQPLEQHGSGWIAYSLGNFVFDQRPGRARRGLMLEVVLRDKEVAGVKTIPITIGPEYQAVITPAEEETSLAMRAPRKKPSKAAPAQ